MTHDVDVHDLLALAVGMAEQASDLLVAALERDDLGVEHKSTATDLVTEVDRAVEVAIVDRIRRSRPHDGILGEEGTDDEGTSGIRWIIDPIDGTTNFLYGHPGFAVSIAAERDGSPLLGVVAVPLHLDVFTAVAGEGAERNGTPIRVSGCSDPSRALVATGFGYEPERRRRQAEVVARIVGDVRDIRRVGAASVDLCSTACGRVDAYYELGIQPWDWAAGALVAREAGARVADLTGGPLGGGVVLAAPEALWDPLAELLVAADAPEV
jgi:myo-inositol-1(or 4)-monophosphatase